MAVDHDVLVENLTRLQLTCIRDQLDSLDQCQDVVGLAMPPAALSIRKPASIALATPKHLIRSRMITTPDQLTEERRAAPRLRARISKACRNLELYLFLSSFVLTGKFRSNSQ